MDILIGAAAGAAATWVMDRVTTVMYERETEEAQRRENSARGDATAYELAAEKGAELAHRELSDVQRKRIGSAIHWSIGMSSGVVYGAARNQFPSLGFGSGFMYGVAIWLALDEGALTLLGLTAPPQAFPWQTHARGLVGHLVLGGAIEGVFDLLAAIDDRSN